MPNIKGITGDNYLDFIIKQEIQKKLSNYESRRKLFNKYHEKDNITFIDTNQQLRNSLAHDLDAPTVNGNELTYSILNKNDPNKTQKCDMLKVLNDLKNHPSLLYKNK